MTEQKVNVPNLVLMGVAGVGCGLAADGDLKKTIGLLLIVMSLYLITMFVEWRHHD